MKIDTLKKKLNNEFNFQETYESLESFAEPDPGNILLTPHYREKQRPWITKAYNEWLKGNNTIVLISQLKPTCKYFKKYLTDIAVVRPVKEPLIYNNQRVINNMIIAVYMKRVFGEPNFTVSFND
jgi:hypothetical protein